VKSRIRSGLQRLRESLLHCGGLESWRES
jgi:hypothetical protein